MVVVDELDDFEVAFDDVRSPRLLRDVLHQEVDCVRATLQHFINLHTSNGGG